MKWTKAQKVASFLSMIEVGDANACWPWKGCVYGGKLKYGAYVWRGKMRGANRVMWEIANGKECPAEMDVLHTCDNSMCVNPAHLWLGTHRDNMKDKVIKGRSWSKLTTAQALAIKNAPSFTPNAEIAKEFGVTTLTVWAIRTGRRWKHLRSEQC